MEVISQTYGAIKPDDELSIYHLGGCEPTFGMAFHIWYIPFGRVV